MKEVSPVIPRAYLLATRRIASSRGTRGGGDASFERRPVWIAALLAIALIAALTLTAAHLTARSTQAQSAPVVNELGAANGFPEGITFQVAAESDSSIEEIRLRYKVLPDGTNARGVPDFEPATSVGNAILPWPAGCPAAARHSHRVLLGSHGRRR